MFAFLSAPSCRVPACAAALPALTRSRRGARCAPQLEDLLRWAQLSGDISIPPLSWEEKEAQEDSVGEAGDSEGAVSADSSPPTPLQEGGRSDDGKGGAEHKSQRGHKILMQISSSLPEVVRDAEGSLGDVEGFRPERLEHAPEDSAKLQSAPLGDDLGRFGAAARKEAEAERLKARSSQAIDFRHFVKAAAFAAMRWALGLRR